MKLGKLAQETDLKKVWPHEARNFTPWIADNLSSLGDILEMDLELVEKESKVGGFSVDILAKESDSDNYVVIENQLEDSNHDHLGKLITYASGKKAKSIVWIVKKARDEHREAIEWLNENTMSEIGFYLLEIELWRIGNSELAPKFNVVAKPNEWAKTVRQPSSNSATQILQMEYWQAFVDYASKTDFTRTFRLRSASAQNWYDLGIGSSKCHLCLEAKKQKKEATVGIYISDDKSLYHDVEKDKLLIEKELECSLEWKNASKASRFYSWMSFDMIDKDSWNDVFQWYIHMCLKFKTVMSRYL